MKIQSYDIIWIISLFVNIYLFIFYLLINLSLVLIVHINVVLQHVFQYYSLFFLQLELPWKLHGQMLGIWIFVKCDTLDDIWTLFVYPNFQIQKTNWFLQNLFLCSFSSSSIFSIICSNHFICYFFLVNFSEFSIFLQPLYWFLRKIYER